MTTQAPAQLAGFTRETLEALIATRDEPQWVSDARRAAWETYEATPMPTRADEQWRRTDLRSLKLAQLSTFTGIDQPALTDASQLGTLDDTGGATLDIGGARAGMTVQRDAATIFAEFAPEIAGQGVVFTDLATAFREHADLIRPHFMTTAVPATTGKFEALHAAFWQGGSFLYVPKGVSVGLPFRQLVLAGQAGAAVFNHTLVVVEEGAEAFMVDDYHSSGTDGQTFASNVVELILGTNAQLRYVQVQDWGRNIHSMLNERALLADRAELKSLHVTLGGKWARHSIGSRLQGRDTLAEMLGISFADGDQFFDHHTWQEHESPYASSDLEFKTALKDSARTVYSGLIRVHEGAQKTDAYQQNRNLILSRQARADTIPNLEIAANDVRCTHGATVSQVEEEHLFYLQARGIPRTEAQKLIVEGFFRPVIDRIPVEEIQDFLQNAIARKVGY
ncbi:MAG TPA: Fe-S cluster assembly protein SufD [Thermomicrobiales bacterium]|jgi:Fe-S cluster assembly protein SufD|nr:Fe-S cluster assembly protein SufD [Thermomicrobiales bacterium]